MTHAYAAMKLLVQRCALMSSDLLLAAPAAARACRVIAQRLASCAEDFLGAVAARLGGHRPGQRCARRAERRLVAR